MLAGGVVWRSAYDVEGDKVWVTCVGKDCDVLRPARGREYGSAGSEVVDAGACPAPEQDSFTERLMNCPQDDGNLASAGVDHCLGATYADSVCRDDAPSAVEQDPAGRRQAQDRQDYDGHDSDSPQGAD
jgi:hypothetical protein